MAQPIRPDRLTAHADELANHHVAQGRPRTTLLRRSTSASYYAVFHLIATDVARQIAPSCSDEDTYRLSRSVDHGRISEVCRWVASGGGRTTVQPIIARLRSNPDLAAFAAIFIRLQEARHAADYDHLAVIRKSTTLAHRREALVALDLFESLRGSPDLTAFLALIALNTPLR